MPWRTESAGIIPARAGFTRQWTSWRWRPPDHPRSRGVYSSTTMRSRFSEGSSPLARGLPHVELQCQHRGGIIPARAGFTGNLRSGLEARGDHPRSRGVYRIARDFADRMGGSSPLARGLPQCGTQTSRSQRIIPARAGFTGCSRSVRARRSDHPRSRGVYASQRAAFSAFRGSSPLARGLPRRAHPDRARGRIIPARAGFTRNDR